MECLTISENALLHLGLYISNSSFKPSLNKSYDEDSKTNALEKVVSFMQDGGRISEFIVVAIVYTTFFSPNLRQKISFFYWQA